MHGIATPVPMLDVHMHPVPFSCPVVTNERTGLDWKGACVICIGIGGKGRRSCGCPALNCGFDLRCGSESAASNKNYCAIGSAYLGVSV